MEEFLQKFRVLRSSFPRITSAVLPLTSSRLRLIIMSPVSSMISGNTQNWHFYRNIFTSICHSVHKRVCIPECTGADTPPLWANTPSCPVHAGIHTPLPSACWDPPSGWPLLRTVRILLKCILVLIKFENKMDVFITHINFISKHHDKCTLAIKFYSVFNHSNLFIQKCQHC